MLARFIIGVILGFIFGVLMVKNEEAGGGKFDVPMGVAGFIAFGYALYSGSYGWEYFVLGMIEVIIGIAIAVWMLPKRDDDIPKL